MVRRLAVLALLPIFAGAVFAGVYFYFYQGGYSPPPAPEVSFESVTAPLAPSRQTADLPAARLGQGLLVVDTMHSNDFEEAELAALTSRVANRGYDVDFMGGFQHLDPEIRLQLLEEKLRRADSLAVISPREPYLAEETALVERFVAKGGRLLLVSDPSRTQRIDTLADRFGLEFQRDYLYNVAEYDQNFRHIFVRDFQPDALTAGVESLVLDIAGSVRSSGPGLAFAGPNTQSSLRGPAEGLSAMAWGDSRNVLGLADFTFMVTPNNSLLDNDRLVSNIASYLTDVDRTFDLADFPYFYESRPGIGVDILLGRPALVSAGLQAKNGLAAYGVPSEVRRVEDVSRDAVFLGLYGDAPQVDRYLQAAGVRVDDALGTPFGPDLEPQGTALMVLHQDGDRYMLVVLADQPDTLAGAVAGLILGEYRGDLVSDFVGVRKEL